MLESTKRKLQLSVLQRLKQDGMPASPAGDLEDSDYEELSADGSVVREKPLLTDLLKKKKKLKSSEIESEEG